MRGSLGGSLAAHENCLMFKDATEFEDADFAFRSLLDGCKSPTPCHTVLRGGAHINYLVYAVGFRLWNNAH
jgi:hypothetical protein